jgi:hypothetical protein
MAFFEEAVKILASTEASAGQKAFATMRAKTHAECLGWSQEDIDALLKAYGVPTNLRITKRVLPPPTRKAGKARKRQPQYMSLSTKASSNAVPSSSDSVSSTVEHYDEAEHSDHSIEEHASSIASNSVQSGVISENEASDSNVVEPTDSD